MIRKPKKDPQESELDVRKAVTIITDDSDTLIVDFDAHLDKLEQLGYPKALIESLRSRLRSNIGDGEPN